ncbi:MAG: SRPBCC domain-containing protein, partial [Desulfobacteraceae bacterium]
MRELFTEIEIKTTPEHLFNILTDFSHFSEWNPFIREIRGEAKEGRRIRVRIEPSMGMSMTFRPVIRRVILNRGFCWQGELIPPGLLDGEHCFEIVPLNNGNVRFVQSETFRGVLNSL